MKVKKKESKKAKMELALEEVLCGFPRKTAIDSIIKNKMIQEDTSECKKKESSQIINDIGRNIVYLRNLSDGKQLMNIYFFSRRKLLIGGIILKKRICITTGVAMLLGLSPILTTGATVYANEESNYV